MAAIEFVVYKDKAGLWRWQLEAGNNWIIADSGEGYEDDTSVEKVIKIIQNSAKAKIRYADDPDPASGPEYSGPNSST